MTVLRTSRPMLTERLSWPFAIAASSDWLSPDLTPVTVASQSHGEYRSGESSGQASSATGRPCAISLPPRFPRVRLGDCGLANSLKGWCRSPAHYELGFPVYRLHLPRRSFQLNSCNRE